MKDLMNVKPGDIVERYISSDRVPMLLQVTEVDDDYIYCGPKGQGWKFLRSCGAEVDEELGWGQKDPETGIINTGSVIEVGSGGTS